MLLNSTSNRLDSQNIGGILGKECIANIGRIFDTALLIKTTPDAKHGTKNRIRRYANAIVSDGETFMVKITVKEIDGNRKELTDIEIENNGGTDLAAYDLKVGRKNTAVDAFGNLTTDKSAVSGGNDVSINDLIGFVNTYTAETIQIDGKEKAMRNEPIDTVLKASDIVYEDGAIRLAPKKEDGAGGQYEQAMYKSKLSDFGSFYDDVIKNENTKDRYFTEDINGVGLDIPRNTIFHDNNKHNLTKEEWLGIFDALRNNEVKEAELGDKTVMNGTPVKMVVDVNGVEYGIAFEHMKNGRNLVNTAFKIDDKGWINEKQKKKSSQAEASKPLPKSCRLGNSMADIISVLDENVNNALFQFPTEAYDTQGRADINTPEFKAWFGDSKVVDENGRPLVVYHGTSVDFDVFKGKYHFFSDSENVAGGYGSQNPLPVYLSMKNPLIVDAYGQSFGEIYNAEGYKKAYKDLTENDYKKIAKAHDLSVDEAKEFFPKNEDGVVNLARAYSEKPRSTNEWAEYAKKNGYDGVIIKDVNDTADISNVRSTDYIVFSPNQIKSVYNRGSFSRTTNKIYYQMSYREASGRGLLFSASENLTTRADGYPIADDNETVDVVAIPENAVPDFKTKTELRNWLIGKFEEVGSITIKATGEKVDFNKTAAQRSIKNARNRNNNIAYPEIKKVVSNAQYSGFRNTDKRHPNVKGQDVYHSGIIYKGVPYSVEFYIDVPLNKGGHNFAGNKIKQIKIAPADTQVTSDEQNRLAQAYGAIYNISLAVLRGKVKRAKYNNSDNTLYQSDPGGMTGHRGQYDAGNRIITLFANADPSTIIHETAHFFLDDMRRFADNAETAEQLNAIYKYVGSLDGQISREQHEYFARSFEAYLMEGKAPNNLLAAAFRKFRNWLGNIYSNIKKLNVDLDDNIRKTFDDMLGSKKLDFAIQLSSRQMQENINSGYIPQSTINKALRLLDEGKLSKADMEAMIDKLKNGELKRNDVGKYLQMKEKTNHINNEQIFYYDRMRYRQQLEHGNVTKADIKKKIDRLLEWSKPRSQNGKLVGRFTDIKVNRFFDNARENLALEKAVALEKIAENMKIIDTITKGEETGNIADLIWQNKLLSIPANRANITLMGDVYNALSDTYNAGRLTNAVTGEVKKAYRQRLVNEAIGVLDQGAGKNWRKDSSALMKALRRTGLNSVAWSGVLDILSMFDKTSTSGQSKLNQRLNVFAEEKKMRMGVYNDGETVSRLIGEALSGTQNPAISVSRYINKELNREFVIEWGGNSKKFTKDQLLDIYMKAKDPGTRKIMLEDKILQFDEEFLARVDEQITDDDKAVADALFEFYREDYEKLNEFYEQHYGISLGRSEFYSPRSMDRGGINVDTGDLRSYAGLSAIKQRRAKAGQIKPKGAFEVLQNHINNVNHYIAFADKLQDINAVLGNPEIKNRIRNLFGEEMNKKISREVARFASNDKLFAADGVNKIMSKLRANYAVSVLGLKPALSIKQLTSFPAYLEHLSVKEFMEGIIDFAKHPKQAIEILSSSELMKTRQTNIIKDFEVVSKSEWIKNLGTKNGFREFLMLNIQLGDRGAIYLGGWPVYKAYLKKTGSHEKAIAEFERITNETQQSSYMSEQSKWQSNPFLNWFTMFQSSQNQYFRKELTALRGLITGRMPKDKVFKTLFVFHFLLPMLFQFVSDGFRWDKTAQLRAGILGSLNGVFVLGKVMERLVDWGIDGKLNYKLGIRELLPPISVFENIGRFLDKSVKYATNDITLEDYIEALKGGVRTLGEMTGLPLKYPMDVTTASADYAKDEEYAKLGLLMLGWSPWALRDFEE